MNLFNLPAITNQLSAISDAANTISRAVAATQTPPAQTLATVAATPIFNHLDGSPVSYGHAGNETILASRTYLQWYQTGGDGPGFWESETVSTGTFTINLANLVSVSVPDGYVGNANYPADDIGGNDTVVISQNQAPGGLVINGFSAGDRLDFTALYGNNFFSSLQRTTNIHVAVHDGSSDIYLNHRATTGEPDIRLVGFHDAHAIQQMILNGH